MEHVDEYEEFRARAMSAGQIQRYRPRRRNLLERIKRTCSSERTGPLPAPGPERAAKGARADTDGIINRMAKLSFGDSFSDQGQSDADRDIDSDDERSDDMVFENTRATSGFHDSGIYMNNVSYGSRRRSVPTRPGARRPSNLPLEKSAPYRPRTHSMPTRSHLRKPHRSVNDDVIDEDVVRVRTFSTSGRGIINRGDSFKSRSSSVTSDYNSIPFTKEDDFRKRAWSAPITTALVAAAGGNLETSPGLMVKALRVLVVGGLSVGKTSLIKQFMTSEYAHDTHDEQLGEHCFTILT